MKHLFFTLAFIFCFTACQNGDGISIKKGGPSTNTNSAPAVAAPDDSGVAKTDIGDGFQMGVKQSDKGDLEERGTYLNGKREGAWTTYHKRSQTRGALVETMTNYKNGVKHGSQIKVSTSGSLEEAAFYVNGKLEGPFTKYERTRVVEETNYLNGQLHGTRKTFYDDGSPQMETNYVNGKREGAEKYYDEEGNITLEYTYKNGERQ